MTDMKDATDTATSTERRDESVYDYMDTEPLPADACRNYDDCGNLAPSNNATCADCLDRMRAVDRDREREREVRE